MSEEHCMCDECTALALKRSDYLIQGGMAAQLSRKAVLDACIMAAVRLCVCNGLDVSKTLAPIIEWCESAKEINPEAFEPDTEPLGQA